MTGGRDKQEIPGKYAFERINFLYQIGLQTLSRQPENVELVRYYMKCLREVKEKKVLRLTKEMKWNICDKCDMLLVPGVTSRIRITELLKVVMTCLSCHERKRNHFLKPREGNKRKRRRKRISKYFQKKLIGKKQRTANA